MNSGKNVLLVTVDQWPGWLLGCAGHPVLQTPTLDQLARNGVRYTKAYSESPICIPARRTLMSTSSSRIAGVATSSSTNPGPAVDFTSALTSASLEDRNTRRRHAVCSACA